MDYILYRINDDGQEVPLPHGSQSRFHTEAEAIARAEELRGEAAALGDVILPGYSVVVESTGETIRTIRDIGGPEPTPNLESEPETPEEPKVLISQSTLRELLNIADEFDRGQSQESRAAMTEARTALEVEG